MNAADVMEDGSPRPLMTSCQSFLLITSTRPPRATTRLYNSNRSNTCLAMIGNRLIGVPKIEIKYMGNFCMSDEGRNGIADRKHEKPPKGFHFRPRARRARGRKWGPAGGYFLCLRSAIPFPPNSPIQKLHLYILYLSFLIEFRN